MANPKFSGPALLAAAMMVAAPALRAAQLPDPPCSEDVPIAPSAAAGEPAVHVWSNLEWNPTACLGWPAEKYRLVIELSGRIDGVDAAELRRRLGAISAMRGMRYWSVTEGAWRELITDAAALAGQDGERRPDFDAGEIRAGASLFFTQVDNRSSSPVTYSMKVIEASPRRIFVETANATPIESMMLTLFPSGTLNAAYVMTRTAARTWSFYAVSATSAAASGLVSLSRASYVNRAKALFAHLSGEPLEAEGAAER